MLLLACSIADASWAGSRCSHASSAQAWLLSAVKQTLGMALHSLCNHLPGRSKLFRLPGGLQQLQYIQIATNRQVSHFYNVEAALSAGRFKDDPKGTSCDLIGGGCICLCTKAHALV